MGMRTVHDSYAGDTPLVDKMLGNAFTTVQEVADNLDEIRYLAANLAAIIALAESASAEHIITVRGVVGALGSTTTVVLPTGVTVGNINSSTVLLSTPGGTVYSSDSNVFTADIISGSLYLNLLADAPAGAAGSAFCWRLVVAGS